MKYQIFFIFIFLIIGCQKNEVTKKEISQIIPVKVMRVVEKDLYKSIEYVGNIKAQDEVIVYPKVSGKIIEKVKEDGSFVDKKEPIAYIDRDEVGLKFENAPVESPINGIVGRIYVDIGANVLPTTPIALVVNMDKVKINLDIPEKYLPQISITDVAKIYVDAFPDEEFRGKVTKISPVVDLTTRTAPVAILVDNASHRLKSGMFARVNLIIEQVKDAPVILKEAIIGKEPDLYVYIIENQKAILRKVSLGIRQGPFFEVRDGLKEGESVVIVGLARLRENAQVTVEMEEEK